MSKRSSKRTPSKVQIGERAEAEFYQIKLFSVGTNFGVEAEVEHWAADSNDQFAWRLVATTQLMPHGFTSAAEKEAEELIKDHYAELHPSGADRARAALAKAEGQQ
ncbi:hypothetical protein F4X86_04260 [Candidatus Saccharibacteria bacterium]|nr:hypothetical protein [Candidatus Saccharibacteria bacterium]